MSGFKDYGTAMRGRDVLVRMMESVVDRMRPDAKLGEVVSKDRNTQVVLVMLPGDDTPIRAQYHKYQEPSRTIETDGSGSIVRIAGRMGAYYVLGVLENGTDFYDDLDWIPILPAGAGDGRFLNGWVNLGTVHAVAAYKRQGNSVRLKGTITGGTVTDPAFILPETHRPAEYHLSSGIMFVATTGAASAGTAHTHGVGDVSSRIDITTDGEVIIAPNGSIDGTYVSLSQVVFDLTA